MKEERHKRKEYYSVLVVSNLNRESRQFRIAKSGIKWLCCLGLIICFTIAGVAGFVVSNTGQTEELRQKLAGQEKQIAALEKEKEDLNSKNEALETELASLDDKAEETENGESGTAEEAGEEEEPALPVLYPSSGVGSLTATFSEDHPYISIGTYHDGKIIAAGDGVVTAIGSDNTYKYVIEVQHEGGYKTRYFYSKTAELKVEEGAQVKGGDVLFTVSEDGVNLDYQVLWNDEPIDPFLVIEADG